MNEKTFKATIKTGALVYQDFATFKWDNQTYNDNGEAVLFTVADRQDHFNCVACGYGMPGHYGNGSIMVAKIEDLIVEKEFIGYTDLEIELEELADNVLTWYEHQSDRNEIKARRSLRKIESMMDNILLVQLPIEVRD